MALNNTTTTTTTTTTCGDGAEHTKYNIDHLNNWRCFKSLHFVLKLHVLANRLLGLYDNLVSDVVLRHDTSRSRKHYRQVGLRDNIQEFSCQTV